MSITTERGQTPTGRQVKSGAAAKAYLKRQRRSELMGVMPVAADPADRTPGGSLVARAWFVVVLCLLLGGGVAGVLVLNTMSDEAGLRTERAAARTAELRREIEDLNRQIALKDNTVAIAEAARKLGLVRAGDAAILSEAPDGSLTIIGTPTPVPGPEAVPPAGTPSAPATAVETPVTAGDAG